MNDYSIKELNMALKVIESSIDNCTNMQSKFSAGTAQATLLKNRIQALEIAKALITKGTVNDKYTKEDLQAALAPLTSIINKSSKGLIRFQEGEAVYTRFKNLIDAMNIAKSFLIDAIENLT